MELSKCIIRPATVVKVMGNNTLKVIAPGLFSKTDDPDLLPPVYPFIEISKNSFSEIQEGNEVWLLNVEGNKTELFWLRKPDYEFGMEDRVAGGNLEIIARRESGSSWAEIYFSDGTGWIIKNDMSYISINKDGNITLSALGNHKTIEINDEGISLGTPGQSAEPAVLGNKLTETLDYLSIILEMVKDASLANPHTYPIGSTLNATLPKLKSKVEKICSSYVALD